MPKARVERVLSDDGVTKNVEVEIEDRDVTRKTTYNVPSNAGQFQELMIALTEVEDGGAFAKSVLGADYQNQKETPLAFAYRMWVTSVDRTAKQKIRESVAAESTFISDGASRTDLMDMLGKPNGLKRLIFAINDIRGLVQGRIFAMTSTVDDSTDDGKKKVMEATETAEKAVKYGPWKAAARRLSEGYEDSDGNKVAPVARENAASGMLEALTA